MFESVLVLRRHIPFRQRLANKDEHDCVESITEAGMTRDLQRIERVQQGLREESLEALICALPNNVLLLTGYWPVIGLSVALATRQGRVALVVPEDEKDLARHSWADEIHSFQPASLKELRVALESVRGPLAKAVSSLKLEHGSAIGYEHDEASVPAPYVAVHFYGPAISELLQSAIPGANLVPASHLLQ
ncbi:MAG TPA: aminopeptidase P family N-terminal domain-containing protein, partial [Candidatus Sulfotelmatobacter sp.]|nr:aminopeptidase P family N-terminal domain-containing protein [Candidatus Sulfotelmatobacter sp.]